MIRRLAETDVGTVLELDEPCPIHSVCTPFPVFRIRRESQETFVAEWNTHHSKGPRQSFRFDNLAESDAAEERTIQSSTR